MKKILVALTEEQYLCLRKMAESAINRTPTGEERNLMTEVNIVLMRDADASGFPHLATAVI